MYPGLVMNSASAKRLPIKEFPTLKLMFAFNLADYGTKQESNGTQLYVCKRH